MNLYIILDTYNYIINYLSQPLLLKPVCHVSTGELVVAAISSLSQGVITNSLSRGEGYQGTRGVPGVPRCFDQLFCRGFSREEAVLRAATRKPPNLTCRVYH